jgi:hypothetical protein
MARTSPFTDQPADEWSQPAAEWSGEIDPRIALIPFEDAVPEADADDEAGEPAPMGDQAAALAARLAELGTSPHGWT